MTSRTFTVGASNARARLFQLLDDVEAGATVIITRRGRPIARLESEAAHRQADIRAAIEELREIGRRNGPVTVEELLSARDEGRRF